MSSTPLINYTQSLLQQLQQCIEALLPNEYSEVLPLLNNASIGQHARHIVELFEELNNGYENGKVDYDQRKRNKLVEIDKQVALAHLNRVSETIAKADKNLLLAVNPGRDSQAPLYINTNYLRELLYNVEHMVHHMAIIRIAVENCFGKKVSTTFGVAEATVKYQQLCAQ